MRTKLMASYFGHRSHVITIEEGDPNTLCIKNPSLGDAITIRWNAVHGPRIDLLSNKSIDRQFRVIPGYKDVAVAVGYSGQGHAYTFNEEGKFVEVEEIVNRDDNIKNPLHRFVDKK